MNLSLFLSVLPAFIYLAFILTYHIIIYLCIGLLAKNFNHKYHKINELCIRVLKLYHLKKL